MLSGKFNRIVTAPPHHQLFLIFQGIGSSKTILIDDLSIIPDNYLEPRSVIIPFDRTEVFKKCGA